MTTERSKELSHAFYMASKKYNVPYNLLIAIAYFESVFRTDKTGDNGRSVGIMQTGIQARKACECDMNTLQGQIDCGACWLDRGRQWCGSLEGGLSAYVEGDCKSTTRHTEWVFQRRLRLWKRLEEDENENKSQKN